MYRAQGRERLRSLRLGNSIGLGIERDFGSLRLGTGIGLGIERDFGSLRLGIGIGLRVENDFESLRGINVSGSGSGL